MSASETRQHPVGIPCPSAAILYHHRRSMIPGHTSNSNVMCHLKLAHLPSTFFSLSPARPANTCELCCGIMTKMSLAGAFSPG
mmetsp:Transcript_1313/g.2840  ORF Transcript_1313/g.2840 Transcript_1313/m.2840 type:complete len:83 (-) Transcript_1313:810-1058(-)